MQSVEAVAIVSKPGVEEGKKIVPELLAWLGKRGIQVRCDKETAAYTNGVTGLPRAEAFDDADLIILLGGDGTLLTAARTLAGRSTPLFAVNLGGLGFLTTITADELFPELERVLRGEHRIGQRRLLHCELWRRGSLVTEYEALNDVVIDKIDIARMIDVDAYVGDQFVCAYKADGLIISTPTGSTAYSLSAGGPIIFPTVEALAITPICPHMLTNRPVIVPLDRVIKLISRAKDDAAFLTIDGQIGEPLKHDDELICRSSDKIVRLIRPPRSKFFDVLRQKLKWGER